MSITFDTRPQRRQSEKIEYRLLYAATFSVCLIGATASRLAPGGRQAYAPADGRRRSVFGDARAAADRIVPFAFMA
ncbi:MAG: hypothetical protein ACMVY4_10980 [Minwuia sp.]|uniref:hypothetical protein n=1 Tax=Minwuia sp. TaxID=2493630 RepID=UPI003A865854